MKRFFSKKVIIFTSFVLIVAVIAVVKFTGGNGKQTVAAKRADIVQEVAVTGKVKPNQSVDLGFDKSGRVANVFVSVGSRVMKGQTLASLESSEISADLAKAKASLEEEKIKFAEIKNTAPISYNNASRNLDAAIREGFADADDAVRNKADQFFKNIPDNPLFEISITSGNFVHYFSVPNDIALSINSERKNIEVMLANWQKRISEMNSSGLVLEAGKSISDLNTVSSFLDKMAGAVNTFTSADYSYDTTVSNYKVTISGARTAVSGAISALVTARDKLNAAPILGEGGQFGNVLTQEAAVSQAQAVVSSLEASLAKSTIKAPFDGVVTVQDAKQGGAIGAGATLISVISQNEMYIEANVSEIHIGKIAAGNSVSVTFDAFPGELFDGIVSYIEPGDVIIDGIVNYKIRVNLKNADEKMKSGMTANLKVETAKKENVVSLPLYAIAKENGQNFVNKVTENGTQKIPVSLGLSGSDGFVEITNGLEVGDSVEF